MSEVLSAVGLVFLVLYLLVATLTGIALSRYSTTERSTAVVAIVSLLWFITIPLGMKKKGITFGSSNAFEQHKAAGFNALVAQNGKWIAGFQTSNLDTGGNLILVAPAFDVAPEDLQEVIATPQRTAEEAIQNSFFRNIEWNKRTKTGLAGKKVKEVVN